MPYFEYVCDDCGVYFESIIDDDAPRNFNCNDCKSRRLRLVGYSRTVPTRIESLQKLVTKLENRINKLLRKIGIDPAEFEKEEKERFTLKN